MQQKRSVSSSLSVRFAKTVIVLFDKVGAAPKPFSLEYQGISLEGTLYKITPHRVELDATIRGRISLDCDRCGQPYDRNLDEHLVLQISDEVAQDKDNLDIIEFLDGRIDILFLLESEINALEGDYHFCTQCETEETTLEMEF